MLCNASGCAFPRQLAFPHLIAIWEQNRMLCRTHTTCHVTCATFNRIILVPRERVSFYLPERNEVYLCAETKWQTNQRTKKNSKRGSGVSLYNFGPGVIFNARWLQELVLLIVSQFFFRPGAQTRQVDRRLIECCTPQIQLVFTVLGSEYFTGGVCASVDQTAAWVEGWLHTCNRKWKGQKKFIAGKQENGFGQNVPQRHILLHPNWLVVHK